jgi:hypothetical protein
MRSADSLAGSDNGGLGGFRSADTLADVVSTITTVTTDRIFIDTAEISSPDRVGAWIVFLDTNLNEAREVVAFDDSTGTFDLDRALPSTPLVSDRYWLFMPNGLFSSYGPADCRSRDPRYRLVFPHNTSGGTLDSIRVYVADLVSGPIECRIAMGTATAVQSTSFDVDDLTDENEAPVLDDSSGFSKLGASGSPQVFRRFRDYTGARSGGAPAGSGGAFGELSLPNTRARPIWIRLSFVPDSPIPRASKAVYQVFVDHGTGATGGVTVSSFLVVVDIDGVVEDIAPVVDRRLRLHGGARASCIVRDSVAPFEPVPGATIRIELGSGPGSMNAPSDTVQRDDGEPVRRIYISPTDPGDIGATVRIDFEVT